MTREEYRLNFGKRLRKLAAEHGLTMYDLAKETGMSASSLYKYAHQYIMPGVDTLAALADVFGMTMDELMGREPKEEAKA